MLCGSSSLLVQVTVVPGATVSVSGTNLKFSMVIWAVLTPGCCASAAALASSKIPAAAAIGRRANRVIVVVLLSQGNVGQCQGMRRRDRNLADADNAAQLLRRHLKRCRAWPFSGFWRWERCRHRGLVGHLALDLLHDLVDVAIEHGHRAKPLEVGQRLRRVLGCPAPLRVQWPHRDVGQDDDRGARGAALQVLHTNRATTVAINIMMANGSAIGSRAV